jgi:hypothetical protein
VKKNPVKPIRPHFFSFTYSVGLGRSGFNYDKLRIIKVEKLSISSEYENKCLLYNVSPYPGRHRNIQYTYILVCPEKSSFKSSDNLCSCSLVLLGYLLYKRSCNIDDKTNEQMAHHPAWWCENTFSGQTQYQNIISNFTPWNLQQERVKWHR